MNDLNVEVSIYSVKDSLASGRFSVKAWPSSCQWDNFIRHTECFFPIRELSKRKRDVFRSPKTNIKFFRCKLTRSGGKHIPFSPAGKSHQRILDGLDAHSSFSLSVNRDEHIEFTQRMKPKGKPRSTILTILCNSWHVSPAGAKEWTKISSEITLPKSSALCGDWLWGIRSLITSKKKMRTYFRWHNWW